MPTIGHQSLSPSLPILMGTASKLQLLNLSECLHLLLVPRCLHSLRHRGQQSAPSFASHVSHTCIASRFAGRAERPFHASRSVLDVVGHGGIGAAWVACSVVYEKLLRICCFQSLSWLTKEYLNRRPSLLRHGHPTPLLSGSLQLVKPAYEN